MLKSFKLKNAVDIFVYFAFAILSIIADYKITILANIKFDELTKIMFSSVLIFAGFWVSCFLLFIQLYKNRYPLEIMKDTFLTTARKNICRIIFIVVWGCILIIQNDWIISQICFIALCATTIIEILIGMYNANKTFMIKTFVEQYANNISNQIEESIIKKGELNKILRKLDSTFEECVIKEEYYICQNISIQIGNVFRILMTKSVELVISKQYDQKQIDSFFNNIIDHLLYHVDMIKKCKSEYFVSEIIRQHYKNLEACIETNQITLFKSYIDELNKLIHQMQTENIELVTELLFENYKLLIKSAIKTNKDPELSLYIMEQCFGMTMSLSFSHKDVNIKHYASLLTYVLQKSIELNNKTLYDKLFRLILKFSLFAAKINFSFDSVLVYYAIYTNFLVNNKKEDELDEFIDILADIQDALVDSSRWLDYVLFLFSNIEKELPNRFNKKLHKLKVELLLEVITSDSKFNNLMLPDYKQIINENLYSPSEIKVVIKEFNSLINRSIMKNSTSVFYFIIKELRDCIESLDKQFKDIQIELFGLFIHISHTVAQINNKQFSEICFTEMVECIHELDKSNNISSGLGDSIITALAESADRNYITNEYYTGQIVELLYEFLEKDNELKFVLSQQPKRQLLYKTIFNIGIHSIEGDQEKTLRKVSNSLGWLSIRSINNQDATDTRYLIDRAYDLYNIASNMQVSDKAKMFLLTLFTTIGTYCSKQPCYYVYRERIIYHLMNVDLINIQTAIKIRTSENNSWDDLFDNKTEELTEKFLQRIIEAKSKKK